MHGDFCPRSVLVIDENTTRTITLPATIVTGASLATDRRGGPCAFVVAEAWRYGAGDPFCGAPAERGSAYCLAHRALCTLTPETPAAAAAVAILEEAAEAATPPPPDLAFLAAPEVPELETRDDERHEIAACLDLPPASRDQV